MDEIRALLLTRLRQTVPVRVRVYDAQDSHYDVAVPTRRKRWSQVIETIEQRPWVRVELLDKSGATLAHVTNVEPADDARPAGALEDISGGANLGAQAARERMMLELMIKAQTTALTYRDREHTALLQSMNACMTTVTTMALQLVAHEREIADIRREADREHAQAQIDSLAHTARAQLAEASASKDVSIDDVVELMREAPEILRSVGPLLMGLGLLKPKPPAPSAPTTPQSPPQPPPQPPPEATAAPKRKGKS